MSYYLSIKIYKLNVADKEDYNKYNEKFPK